MPSASLALSARTQQAQVPSLRLQQAVRLLQMSSQDFLQTVNGAVQDNPFLDGEHDDEDAQLPIPLQALVADAPVTDLPQWPAADDETPVGKDHDAQDEVGLSDAFPADDWGRPGSAECSGISALDLTPAPVTLAAHLHAQLNLLRLPPRDLILARAVVELLDDDGYLRCDPGEALAAWKEIDTLQGCPDELNIAVRRVQSLEPAGVGARSVQECLLLQVGEVGEAAQRALVRSILMKHLPKLAANNLGAIARSLRRPLHEVEVACARIRRFSPRPGWRHGGTAARYIVPDVIVQRHKGGWRAVLNPAIVPRVRLNRRVVELFGSSRKIEAPSPGMTCQLQEARWTLRNVEQRFSTIVAVAQAIIERQKLFFEHGELAMKPLGLRVIAEAVGVHDSTVSRVTSNKYIATPQGVFELKHFFSRGLSIPSGKPCSSTALRSLVREMILAESADRPLRDAELADRLRMQGFPLARRTITKYRLAMNIEVASRRRPAAGDP